MVDCGEVVSWCDDSRPIKIRRIRILKQDPLCSVFIPVLVCCCVEVRVHTRTSTRNAAFALSDD